MPFIKAVAVNLVTRALFPGFEGGTPPPKPGKSALVTRLRSCTTHLCTVIHDLSKTIDQGLQTDVFILDFAKAFDSVPHERLNAKLFRYGINGKTIAWINNFLCHRHQRVAVNRSKPDWTPVVSAVPQGTVLGPVLFNIFIIDIVDEVESGIRLFADDCVCYRLVANVEDCEKLQKDIYHLTSWAKKCYMRFEPSKCKIMGITRKTTHKITYQYTMEHTSLESVQHTKYLGVTISDDHRWNRHVADITGCATRTP